VIDDDPDVRDLMRRFLGKEGFSVAAAANGDDGLALARRLKPAVITLDILMPGRDGWSVLSALKADPELARIPVVLVSILDDQPMGFALGASDYVTKPINWERLIAILDQYRTAPGPQRVLVVEDDADTRRMLQRQLEKNGWEVSSAENGRAALECLARQSPAVILLDLMMPEMDGFEFMRELRRREHRIPVIVITAKELTEEDHRQLNGQVIQILRKGNFTPDELLRELRAILAQEKSYP
jgi:CheY-like chemotaxis protein